MSKKAPVVQSAKEPVSRLRKIGGILADLKTNADTTDASITARRNIRDPRFGNISGTFDPSKHAHQYAFISEMQKKELQELKSLQQQKQQRMSISKHKKAGASVNSSTDSATDSAVDAETQKINLAIQRITSQAASQARQQQQQQLLRQHRTKQLEAIRSGQAARPYFLGKKEQQEQLLRHQYEEMKAANVNMDKFLEKRQQKIASKQHKHLPNRPIRSKQ